MTLTAPVAATYLIEIDGFAAAPGESAIGYRYDDYLITPTGLGSFGDNPNPVPVTQGQDTTFNAVWSGLASGQYLDYLEYDGALAPTSVYVDAPSPDKI